MFEPIKQSYRDFADKYKLHMTVAKLGYTPERREPGKGSGNAEKIVYAQFHYQVKLTIGSDTLTNKPKGAPLVINWHCGEAVPMSDPAVIARARVPSYMKNPQYKSWGRITLDQDKVNQAFIQAATAIYEPSIVDILGCLKSDLSCVYYEGIGFAVTFEEFCGELGMNTDSISDKQCYEAVMTQS